MRVSIDRYGRARAPLDGRLRIEFSAYHAPGVDGIAYINIGLDPTTFGFVKREYTLVLRFGRDGRLEDIQARGHLTGP